MDWLRTLLETSPMTTLFLVIAAGYLIGEVNFKGFALGSGAVLFVGLACGAFAPKSAPPGLLGTLGLMLFLYCVGILYGNEWYRGLTSPEGLKANFVGLCGLAAASAVSLMIFRAGAASLPHALGMYAGSGTSTPTLQPLSASDRTREEVPMPPLNSWQIMPVPPPTQPSVTGPSDASSSAAQTCSDLTCMPLMSLSQPSYVSATTGRLQPTLSRCVRCTS